MTTTNTSDTSPWNALTAPVPPSIVQWRQQGKAKQRDGKWFAPFVAYIDAQFVRERLDACFPAEWDLTLDLLPPLLANGDGEALDEPCAFKARLQILGVIREDVGMGRDYKNAATDAFKRAAVRFGIGHELYTEYEITWVQVDSDSKFAKPVEDPGAVYARKHGQASANTAPTRSAPRPVERPTASTEDEGNEVQPASADVPLPDEPSCPKCGGRMWDNRLNKRNPKAPDHKCRSRSCDGVIWPPKNGKVSASRGPQNDDEPYGDASSLPF